MAHQEEGSLSDRIRQVFMEIYDRKPLHEVTVKEICAGVGIARTTFYNYYSDVYDLLECIENDLIHDLEEMNGDFTTVDLHDITEGELHYYDEMLDYIWERKAWFRTLLNKDRDSQFIYKWKQAIKNCFRDKLHYEHYYFQSEELVLEVGASVAIGVYSYWVNTSENISRDTISQEVLLKCFRAFMQ